MPPFELRRRVAVEALGTALLVSAVVGSGIMTERLTEDTALALLCNAVATGAMLTVLIAVFGPISGAHFNPAVSVVFALKRQLSARELAAYFIAQVGGGVAGTFTTHAMFGVPLLQLSSTVRSGAAQLMSEAIATFGLVTVIVLAGGFRRYSLPWLVGIYITAAYWFTASTSFANPAVSIARSLTATFSGIRPTDVPTFFVAQFAGALLSVAFTGWVLRGRGTPETARNGRAKDLSRG